MGQKKEKEIGEGTHSGVVEDSASVQMECGSGKSGLSGEKEGELEREIIKGEPSGSSAGRKITGSQTEQ